MNKFIPDTNTVISFITDRNKKLQEIISRFFDDASHGSAELMITDIVINEFVYVMDTIYKVQPEQIAEILRSLISAPGVTLVSSFDPDIVLELWPSAITDYGDAVLAYHALKLNIPIITFDQKLIKQMKTRNIPYHKI